MLNKHLCTRVLLPFLSFSLLVLLNISLTGIKRIHYFSMIELLSNVCQVHPPSSKSIKRQNLCTYSRATGNLVKVDTNPETPEWRRCCQARGGRRHAKLGKLGWQAGWGAGERKMEGHKRQEEREGLQMAPGTDLVQVSMFPLFWKFKERQLSARQEVALGIWF